MRWQSTRSRKQTNRKENWSNSGPLLPSFGSKADGHTKCVTFSWFLPKWWEKNIYITYYYGVKNLKWVVIVTICPFIGRNFDGEWNVKI